MTFGRLRPLPDYPTTPALYPVSVRRIRVYGIGFLQIPPPGGHPCLALRFRSSRPAEDLHLLETQHAWRTRLRGDPGRSAPQVKEQGEVMLLWLRGIFKCRIQKKDDPAEKEFLTLDELRQVLAARGLFLYTDGQRQRLLFCSRRPVLNDLLVTELQRHRAALLQTLPTECAT